MDRAFDLKSEDPEFKSRSDHQLDLFNPGSTPRLRLNIGNCSAFCQLGFLTCQVYFSSLFIGPEKPQRREVNNVYIHTHISRSQDVV